MSKKNIQVLLLLVICSINAIAQTVYYYSGKKIPLKINEDKVCVSIPKSKEGVCLELLKKIEVLDTIIDEYYDIAIIRKSDLKKIISYKFLEKRGKVYINITMLLYNRW